MSVWAERSSMIAFLVAGAFFMENLDGTVIVTAMPKMAASFGIRPVDLNIGISAYLLTLAVLIPVSGWVADRLGTRMVFGGAMAIFTIASIFCGLSESLSVFTAARILQGFGGAMMVPVGRLAVLRNTKKQDLMRAIATITWPGLAAPILGPPVGGFITTYASWRWIFFLNLPLGILGLVLSLFLIPKGRAAIIRPFDYWGFVLTGVACFGLMFGLDLVSRQPTSWLLACGCLIGCLIAGLLAVRHSLRKAQPLIDLWAFRLRSFAVAIHSGGLSRIAIGAIPFLLPLLFQVGFGLDAFASGLLVLCVFAGNLAMKSIATPVLRRFGFRTTLLVSGLINAGGIFSCAYLTPAMPWVIMAAILFVNGLTRSMMFTALNTLAFADVPEAQMSGANTLFNMMQQLTMGIGIACGALALRIAAFLVPGISGAIPLADFRIAFILIGLISLASVIYVLGLDANAGDNISRLGPTPGAAKSSARLR
jgi:EmrB/QacA subfamily drug resistance transporter